MCNLLLCGHRLCTRCLIARAWTIYKIGIFYERYLLDNVFKKRYLIMLGILRWHVQLIIVWSQIVHQALETRRRKVICPVPPETQISVGHQLPGV